MTLTEIIKAYQEGQKVTPTELAALSKSEAKTLVEKLLVDKKICLNALPQCLHDPDILEAINNRLDTFMEIVLTNVDIFHKLIPDYTELLWLAKDMPNYFLKLTVSYSLFNESIDEIVERLVDCFEINIALEIALKGDGCKEKFEIDLIDVNRWIKEKCSLISALNEKLKDLYQQPAKSQAEKDQLKKFRDQIIDLEESFPQLTDSNEWQTEKAKFLDFFNWRCSSLVNATVAFLREKYPATTLTVIEKGMVPTDLRQKLEAPTVNQTFRARAT